MRMLINKFIKASQSNFIKLNQQVQRDDRKIQRLLPAIGRGKQKSEFLLQRQGEGPAATVHASVPR